MLRELLNSQSPLGVVCSVMVEANCKSLLVVSVDIRISKLCFGPGADPVLGSQPAGDASHKPGGKLPLLSSKRAVTLATLKGPATSFAGW